MRRTVPPALLLVSLVPFVAAQDTGTAAAEPAANPWQKQFTWRELGPANMGGRITDLAVYEKDPSTFWLATATAGLLKTTNNGITFEHQFDRESTVSVGAVAVAQSNPDIVWVGTGENNPRNSVSYGDGVYKSVDGGKTWKHTGLRESFQTGDIVIHPEDPKVVWVGALGRLYGPHEERGLYKTTDGGETWKRTLFVDDKTGVIDIALHPTDPDVMLVATYERERDGFDTNDPAKKWGPGSGLHRSEDGGKTFTKVTDGLPSGTLGRIGLDWYRKDPGVVYAIVESDMIGKPGAKVGWPGLEGEDAETGAKLTEVSKDGPAAKAGLQVDDIVLRVDGETVLSYRGMLEQLARHEIDASVKVEYARKGKSETVDLVLAARPKPEPRNTEGPGGAVAARTAPPQPRRRRGDPERPFGAFLGGQTANIHKLQGKDGHEHGGVYRSADAGRTWTRVNSINPRPMYFSQVRVDPSDESRQWVLGVSLARSEDRGETYTGDGGRGVHSDHHAMWIDPRDGRHIILGGDGGCYVTYDRGAHWDHLNHMALGQFYHVAVGPRRDYWVYGGLQDNGTWGAPHRGARANGTINEDWIRVGGGDGFVVQVDREDPLQIYYESQNGGTARTHLRTMDGGRIRAQAPKGVRYRYNWRTPFILSAHNSRVYYNAGNHVFRSWNRGDDLKSISPDITRTERGSATALAESPRDLDVLYVGTDDGALWMTKDGGKEWHDLWVIEAEIGAGEAATAATEAGQSGGPRAEATRVDEPAPLASLTPGPRWVSSIEASRFETGRVYLTLDGHRSDDDDPHVFVSEDFGKTWSPLHGDLPRGSTRVVREDRVNENLLYLGTEFGLWVSLDRGASWERFHNNLPTVPVHEVAQHESCGDVVIGTHGRSLWSVDVTPLRQMTEAARNAEAWLYQPSDVIVWQRQHRRGTSGARRFYGDNPSTRAQVYYQVGKGARAVKLHIEDPNGAVLRELETSSERGLHRATWDLRKPAPAGQQGRWRRSQTVSPGTYRAVLEVDGERFTKDLAVQRDPGQSDH